MRAGVMYGAAFAVLLCGPARASLVISKAPTSNMTCIGGMCSATAANAVLNENDFKALLVAGDLTVVSGAQAQDIVIDAKVHYAKTHHLTLDSYRGISFLLELASEGGGGVTLTTNDGGSGGALTFSGKGKLTFWDTTSALAINGTLYTIVNDVATLASGIAANPSGAFAFGRGYDASADGTYGAPPIATGFSGTLNGLGHTIVNLTISRTNKKDTPMALFTAILFGGMVSDISLDAARVQSVAGGNDIALFAGSNAGTIRNVSVSGNLSTSGRRGFMAGLVVLNTGLVDRSRSSGGILGGPRYVEASGLVSDNQGTVSRSTSSMGVRSSDFACGLVGSNEGTVTLSSATGGVGTPTPHNAFTTAAGLVCNNGGTISQSFATGGVYAGYGKEGESHDWTANGGGLVTGNYGTVQDCYAIVDVSASPDLVLGGLVADSNGTVATSYAAGPVTVVSNQVSGGLIGDLSQPGTDTDTYWDLNASGISDPSHGAGNVANAPGITGLTTAQFQSGLPAGFDPAIWAESAGINNGYPYLIANPPQ